MLPKELTEYERTVSKMSKDDIQGELETRKQAQAEIDIEGATGLLADDAQYRFDCEADKILILETALAKESDSRREQWYADRNRPDGKKKKKKKGRK